MGREGTAPTGSTGGSTALSARLDALEDVRLLLERHGFDLQDVAGAAQLDHARARLRHGSDHTVVALVGSTGSGKSSLLNALVGAEIARTGVTRPTTSVTQAVTVGPGADALLDLIGVSRRHHLSAAEVPAALAPSADGTSPDAAENTPTAGSTTAGPPADASSAGAPATHPAPAGLVLLDLPDFDSVSVAHRLEVDRLITLVDLLVWVTDPQKYADEVLHQGYLKRFSTHGDVMRIALNKVDTVPDGRLPDLLGDLRRLLADDGLPDMQPIPTSTLTPGGVDALRRALADAVATRQASLDRIDRDLRQQAAQLADIAGTGDGDTLPATLQDQVAEGLSAAAGVDHIAALVAAQHRRDAALATGWPPLRWIRRVRRAPLERLETTAANQVAGTEVSRTLRRTAATATDVVGPRWADAAAETVRDQITPVTDALDRVVTRDVQVLRRPPRWWGMVSAVHTVLLLAAVVGGLWLGGLALAQALLLIDPEPFAPRVGTVPLPTLLLLGGLAAGLLLGLLSRWTARVGGRRQGRRAVTSLHAAIAEVARDQVVAPLQSVLADRDQVAELLRTIAPTVSEGPRRRLVPRSGRG